MARHPNDPVRTVEHLDRLDPLLQHRSRLGVLVLLSTVDRMTFSALKPLLDETDGNLGAQLRKLEDGGYVSADKTFEARKPVTWYALEPAGRAALVRHLGAMESLIAAAGVRPPARRQGSPGAPGVS